MSRKDYQLIANVLRETREALGMDPACEDAIATIQSRLAAALLRDNPRFDPYRFGKACLPAEASRA
jgi:hypothetical protein